MQAHPTERPFTNPLPFYLTCIPHMMHDEEIPSRENEKGHTCAFVICCTLHLFCGLPLLIQASRSWSHATKTRGKKSQRNGLYTTCTESSLARERFFHYPGGKEAPPKCGTFERVTPAPCFYRRSKARSTYPHPA